ncbi:hypothetical protein AN958_02369 [Leucoagaricus sp. SymC.cos]|nr:hypothetical protein AN958_02369 [Leucoagaricus sp. SymC.cos]
MRGNSDVAVFWDLGACPVPRSISGYEVVDKIRVLSQKLGIVKSFRGYADLTNLAASHSLLLRSELQSSGVSMIDCPTTGHKSIASQTMIVDMMTHAADNPTPTTLVVVAGNQDFSYAISILRLRLYEVILVSPKDRTGQYSQASAYLDWFDDLLGYQPSMVHDTPLIPPRSSRQSRANTNTTAMTTPPTTLPSQDRPTPSAELDLVVSPSDLPQPSDFYQGLGEPTHRAESVDHWNDEEDFPPIELVLPSPPTATELSDAQNKTELERIRTMSLISLTPLDIQRPSSAPPSYTSFSPAPSPSSEDLYGPSAFQPFDASDPTQEHPPARSPIPASTTMFHSPAPDTIPDHFKPLVKKLQERRAQGQSQPLRPSVAAEIVSSHKDEMQVIGAASFLQYAQVAEQAGIVELSGLGERPWIALRPELYEYALE